MYTKPNRNEHLQGLYQASNTPKSYPKNRQKYGQLNGVKIGVKLHLNKL